MCLMDEFTGQFNLGFGFWQDSGVGSQADDGAADGHFRGGPNPFGLGGDAAANEPQRLIDVAAAAAISLTNGFKTLRLL